MKRRVKKNVFFFVSLSILGSLPVSSYAATWNCWGRQNVSQKNYSTNRTLNYNTDICVRNDERPLDVDVYLHDIKYSGNVQRMARNITVEVTDKKTNKTVTQSVRDFGNYSKYDKEYVHRFEFTAPSSGSYEVKLLRVTMEYWNSNSGSGGDTFNYTTPRKGSTNISAIPTCQ